MEQVICATAGTMSLIYYGYYEMWSTFIPCVLSVVFILYLLGLKIYKEEYASRSQRSTAAANEPLASGLGCALLPEAHVKSDQGAARTP